MTDISGTESFKLSKFVITWWDLVDHYLLATMLAISLASVALQTTQDRLICIPAVHCSRNDSALCNRSSSDTVHLFKMPDRRHYDYIDNECYSKMDYFSAYYSLIFLVETVIFLAISKFWQKYPNSANALARCEHLVSEVNKGEILMEATADDLVNRLKVFLTGYDKSMPWGGVTKQYRLRGVLGFIAATACLSFNVASYNNIRMNGWSQCKLEKVHYATKLEGSFFDCSRTVAVFLYFIYSLFLVFISGHLLLAFGSFFWAYCRLGRKPRFAKTLRLTTIPAERSIAFAFSHDAAFLLHLLENTGCSFVDTVVEEQERAAESPGMERAQMLEELV
ncbi:uncharacterized protein LOC114952040 [Acropora millepora]|uniref:uncharacterized protein LOC114952040 n=1 Tax=Acropora millepora TaxID=45264 RepID=UPI001CF12E3A|nr:uncharacterized protein LOC114952040 [Acropora millepora]